ncbi:MAG: hypothetical protein PVF35_03955, partial [Gammaproteobacteria bacterium]
PQYGCIDKGTSGQKLPGQTWHCNTGSRSMLINSAGRLGKTIFKSINSSYPTEELHVGFNYIT